MKLKNIIPLAFCVTPTSLFAAMDSYYCPQGHGYVKIGMSVDEVSAACGEPISRQDANKPVTSLVPVKQLIYNNQGTDTPYYWYNNYWAALKTGSGGIQMEINVVDNRVKLIRVNSSNSNQATVCNGVNIRIGDSLARVYNACGSPSIQNNSYIQQIVTTTAKPQIWIYQLNMYQPKVTFTFADGRLYSINQ